MGSDSVVPNFFLVGAHKSGTTALHAYLRQHPQIFLSPRKEPRYFVREFWPESLEASRMQRPASSAVAGDSYRPEPVAPVGVITEWEDYLELFRGAKPEQAIGEASVGYLWSPTAARRIHEKIPGARILMILRNPCDRAFSHYNGVPHAHRRESFAQAIRRSAASPPAPYFHTFHPFLEFGMYSAQVARYMELFPPMQVRVFFYDDFIANREGLVRDVFDFLGVRRDVPLDLARRYNEPRIPRFPRLESLLRRRGRWFEPWCRQP